MSQAHPALPLNTPPAGKSNFLPISELVYSLIAAMLYFGLALAFGLFGLYEQFNKGEQYSQTAISVAWGLALMGLLLLPAAALSIYRLYGRRLPGWLRALLKFFDQVSLFSILLWPFAIGAGVLATQVTGLSWLLLPPFNLLAVGLPILWIFSIGRRSLVSGSPLRHWGSFSIGVVLTPMLSFIFEALLLMGVGVIAAVLLGQNPDAVNQIQRDLPRLLNSGGDTETINRILRPILSNPAVIFSGLGLMSGLVPLIEELLKPLPAWLLGQRLRTPADGFVAGLLGGAGYTLAESLGASGAFDSTQWVGVVIGRAGTDLLHILTSGLMGLALYYAFKEGKYLRLLLTYLMVVVIHGLWNFFSLWSGFYPIIFPTGPAVNAFSRLPAYISPIGLGILVLAMLALLLSRNASLRRAAALQSGMMPAGPAAGTPGGSIRYNETDLQSPKAAVGSEKGSVVEPEIGQQPEPPVEPLPAPDIQTSGGESAAEKDSAGLEDMPPENNP